MSLTLMTQRETGLKSVHSEVFVRKQGKLV